MLGVRELIFNFYHKRLRFLQSAFDVVVVRLLTTEIRRYGEIEMEIKGDDLIFTTGKVKYANGGIIGIDSNLEVTGGYDHDFHTPRQEWMDDEDFDGLTKQEQFELADHMIKIWGQFKAKAV